MIPDEQITVAPAHVRHLLRTLDAAGELEHQAQAVAAATELSACALTQPPDAEAWRVPAGAAFVAATYADAIKALGLDPDDRASRYHPAVLAPEEILRAVAEQAPHTTAAVDAVLDARISIMADYLGVTRTEDRFPQIADAEPWVGGLDV